MSLELLELTIQQQESELIKRRLFLAAAQTIMSDFFMEVAMNQSTIIAAIDAACARVDKAILGEVESIFGTSPGEGKLTDQFKSEFIRDLKSLAKLYADEVDALPIIKERGGVANLAEILGDEDLGGSVKEQLASTSLSREVEKAEYEIEILKKNLKERGVLDLTGVAYKFDKEKIENFEKKYKHPIEIEKSEVKKSNFIIEFFKKLFPTKKKIGLEGFASEIYKLSGSFFNSIIGANNFLSAVSALKLQKNMGEDDSLISSLGRRMQRSGLEISDKKTREGLSKSPSSAKASRRIT